MIAELSPWQKVEQIFHCEHPAQMTVKYQQSNGQWRIRKQCQCCGEYTTSDMKMAGVNLSAVPEVNVLLRESYRKQRSQAYEEKRQEYQDEIDR